MNTMMLVLLDTSTNVKMRYRTVLVWPNGERMSRPFLLEIIQLSTWKELALTPNIVIKLYEKYFLMGIVTRGRNAKIIIMGIRYDNINDQDALCSSVRERLDKKTCGSILAEVIFIRTRNINCNILIAIAGMTHIQPTLRNIFIDNVKKLVLQTRLLFHCHQGVFSIGSDCHLDMYSNILSASSLRHGCTASRLIWTSPSDELFYVSNKNILFYKNS